MRISCGVLTIAVLAGWVLPTKAVDLTKIDRTIAKEPVYQTKAPKYCLLVFGPRADFHVWLVLDGSVLYVDRNGNGDLTEKGERILRKNGEFFEVYGSPKLANKVIRNHRLRVTPHSHGTNLHLLIEGKPRWYARADRQKPLKFADRVQDAPILHFHGPRAFGTVRFRHSDSVLSVIYSPDGKLVALFCPS